MECHTTTEKTGLKISQCTEVLTRGRCWNTVVTNETTKKKQIPITMPHVAAIGSRRCELAASVGCWHHRRYGWKDAAMLAWLLAMRVYDSDGDRKPAPASTASPPNTPHGTQHLTHKNTTTATARVSRLLTAQQHNEAVQCHSHWFTQENTGERTSWKTENTQIKFNSEKTNNAKHSKTKQNQPGLVASYDTRERNKVGLFYIAHEPTRGKRRVRLDRLDITADKGCWLQQSTEQGIHCDHTNWRKPAH